LAKKKLTGGWRILQDFCLECVKEDDQLEDNRSTGSRGSRYSRKSATSRSSRKSAGGTRGKRPSTQDVENETDSQSSSKSAQNHKKLVKKMNFTDDDGEEGFYTGHVNSQYKPHGSGKMHYRNGKRFSGEWCEGSMVHGKMTTSRSGKFKKKADREDGRRDNKSNKETSSKVRGNGKSGSSSGIGSGRAMGPQSVVNGVSDSVKATPTTLEQERQTQQKPNLEQRKQDALRDYKALYNTAQVVKNMLFVDFYGDRGRYTGEVNEQTVPHGMGAITYDHGLVQEGNWTNGVLDEDGSITSAAKNSEQHNSKDGMELDRKPRRRTRSKDP